MDIPVKKYIQYKIRTLNLRKKEFDKLNKRRNELRQQIIDESPGTMDGLPRGKGRVSNPVESKVIKMERIDKRIEVLESELKKFAEIENKIRLMRVHAV